MISYLKFVDTKRKHVNICIKILLVVQGYLPKQRKVCSKMCIFLDNYMIILLIWG
jgi:hypothetical protein